jgi:hypothetical protein
MAERAKVTDVGDAIDGICRARSLVECMWMMSSALDNKDELDAFQEIIRHLDEDLGEIKELLYAYVDRERGALNDG